MYVQGMTPGDQDKNYNLDSIKATPPSARAPIFEGIIKRAAAQETADQQMKELEAIVYRVPTHSKQDANDTFYKLIGYTTGGENSDQSAIKATLKRQDENTIYGFLSEYRALAEENGEDNFFTQMVTEYAFPEKQSLIREAAQKLVDHFKDCGIKTCEDSAKKIEKILRHDTISKSDAKELDDIFANLDFNGRNSKSTRGLLPS